MERLQYSNSNSELIRILIVGLFFITFVAQGTAVPTGSMEPTILVGDRLILDRFTLRAGKLKWADRIGLGHKVSRGDILVFRPVVNPEGEFLVKRVVGLPGEILEIKVKQVYINGNPLNEPYASFEDPMIYSDAQWAPPELYQRDNFGPMTIPEASYFVMGDNRDRSLDSRYWGFVPQDHIIGRPLLVFWSYEDEPYRQRTAAETAILYAQRALHFFSKTRWRRTGTIIK